MALPQQSAVCIIIVAYIIYLSGENEVGEDEDGGSVAHEVGDGLHDVPAVLPPREASKEAKLEGHPAKPRPQNCKR